MTDYRSMYDRNYLGHFDIPEGVDTVLTIKSVSGGELTGSGGRKSKKPIVSFMEDGFKPLACNKTNGKTIANLYSNVVEQWSGKRIAVYVAITNSPEGEVPCVRVRPKTPEGAAKPVRVASSKDGL